MTRPLPFVGATLALLLAGCGGGGGGGSQKVTSLTIAAPSGTVAPGGTLAFTAFVKGDGTVRWSVDRGAITSGGVFTAPTTQGNVVVTATAGGQTATQTISVTNGIAIALTSRSSPPSAIPLSKLLFTASVTGASDKKVLWSVNDSTGAAVAGAIASDGTFTAPAAGAYTVVGTAEADAAKTIAVPVSVVANLEVQMQWFDSTKTALKGSLFVSLRPDVAPNTAANFVTLVNKGFYNGIVLHRKTSVGTDGIGVIQWGDPLTKTLPLSDPSIGTGGPGYTIPYETTGLSNVAYSLAMARSSDINSGGSQVFVNLVDDSAALDAQQYAVFGAVTTSSRSVADALVVGDVLSTAITVPVGTSAIRRR